MSAEWYVQKDGRQQGPFTAEQLQQMSASGQLQPGDPVCKQGMSNWIPAANVQGLFPASGQTPAAGFTPAGFSQPGSQQPYASPQTAQSGFMPAQVGPKRRSAVEKVIYPTSFQSLLRVGAVILIAALFVPWWSITLSEPLLFGQLAIIPEGKPAEARKWYIDHAGKDNWEAQGKKCQELIADGKTKEKVTMWLWGWHTTGGMLAFAIGLLIGGLAILEAVVAAVRPWGWLFWFVATALAVPALALGAMWFVQSPSADEPGLRVMFFAGPFLAVGGAALAMLGGIVCGIIGLRKRSS